MLLLLFSGISFGQQAIVSGEYESELKLAYNPKTQKVTGYYENATGENDQFTCIFYIEGTVSGKQFKIQTYYPDDKSSDLIKGTMTIVNPQSIKIKLPEEHGGCWNVEHFADEPVSFITKKPTNWIQICYVVKDKSYFFKEKSEAKKMKSYLVKNDFVCVEKIEKDWAYCTYFGDTTTKGWIKVKDLNQF
jgi:hypothetical protein